MKLEAGENHTTSKKIADDMSHDNKLFYVVSKFWSINYKLMNK